MEQIIENNKLIAEFMGITLQNKKYQYKSYNSSNEYYWEWGEGEVLCDEDGHILEDEEGEPIANYGRLMYYTWNWLMPVVDRIEYDYQFSVSPTWEHCVIMNAGENVNKFYMEIDGSSKIEATYNAVVEFIKWYNENKEG